MSQLHDVMAGLVPAIHVFHGKKQDVDASDKRGHDGLHYSPSSFSALPWAIRSLSAAGTGIWSRKARACGID
jgi:hypothetical protein